MKKILYFDCFSGISGDMTLGALIDLGVDKENFLNELQKINIDGYNINFNRVTKNGISANKVNVLLNEQHSHQHKNTDEHVHEQVHEHHHEYNHEHHHDHNKEEHHSHGIQDLHTRNDDVNKKQAMDTHHHEHLHRNFFDIVNIIESSSINEEAKRLAINIFKRVAIAEAKVHNTTIEEVHFHEVGAIDSIVDIIGTAILIEMLSPDAIYASVLHDGHGFIKCQHGMIPVPAPATMEILASANITLEQIDIKGELITPTGAAIIAELSESFGIMPKMKIEKIGYGAGEKDFKIPNILRVYMGELIDDSTEQECKKKTSGC